MAKMTFTVGDVFYRAGVIDDGKAYVDEYHLRSIRKGRAYITLKIDGGNWHKGVWDNYIPAWCRKSFSIEPKWRWDSLPDGYAKSRAAALTYAITEQTKYVAENKTDDPNDIEYIAAQEKGLRALKYLLTKTRNQIAKKKAVNVAKRAAKPVEGCP